MRACLAMVFLSWFAGSGPVFSQSCGDLDLQARYSNPVVSGQPFEIRLETSRRGERLELHLDYHKNGPNGTELAERLELSGASPVRVPLRLPKELIGPVEFAISGYQPESKRYCNLKLEFVLVPDPEEKPLSLNLDGPRDEKAHYAYGLYFSPTSLTLAGLYADGRRLNLSAGRLGARYTSADPEIARVAPNGSITPLRPGYTYVEGEYAGVRVRHVVTVADLATEFVPLKELTSRVQLRLEPLQTGREKDSWQQSFTLTNAGDKPIVGPHFLVLDGLAKDSHVVIHERGREKVFDSSEPTRLFRPRGTPALALPCAALDDALLEPGETCRFELRFHSHEPPASFHPRLYSGSHI